MNRHIERVWFKFEQNIVAVNDEAALMLLSYLRQAQLNGLHYSAIEIIDLQRYKLITRKNLVRNVLHLPSRDLVFIFPVCKN